MRPCRLFRSGIARLVNVGRPRAGAPTNLGFAQVVLARDQLDGLARYLRQEGDRLTQIELSDPDDHGLLLGLWNHQDNRVALTLHPSHHWDADPPVVVLTLDRALALADFLS